MNSVGGVDVSLRLILENIDSSRFECLVIHGENDTNRPFTDNTGGLIEEFKIEIEREISIFRDIRALRSAFKIVRDVKPDIIHAHSAKGGVIGKLAGMRYGIPTLHTPQAYSYLSVENRLKKWFYLIIERLTSFGKIKVLASSESERRRAVDEVRYPEEKALLFNNSIIPTNSIQALGIEQTWPSEYICSVGRPSFQKNIEMMLQVLSRVKMELPDIHLVLMGIGYHSPNLKSIQNLIEELQLEGNITMLSWTSREDIFNIVSHAKFYISTARYEGLPYSIIETLMLGKSAVVTDCDGNRDLIKDGYNGYVVNQHEVDTMADRIVRLFKDESLRKGFEKNAREYFTDNFDMTNNIELLQAIYEREIKQNHK